MRAESFVISYNIKRGSENNYVKNQIDNTLILKNSKQLQIFAIDMTLGADTE